MSTTAPDEVIVDDDNDDIDEAPAAPLPELVALAALLRSLPDDPAALAPTAPLPKIAFAPTPAPGPRVLPQLVALSSTKPTST